MALSVTGSGPYDYTSSLGGAQSQHAGATYTFFSGLVTCNPTYAVGNSGDPTILDFGAVMNEIVIINYGTAELVFQWKESWGKSFDSGIVLPQSLGPNQVVLRMLRKSGMKLRSGEAGITQALVWCI